MSTSTKAGPSSQPGQPILTVRGVTKSFPGVRALKGVDLTIYPGEVHALVGENGAGKSTLMKILAGAQGPDGGEIKLDGKSVHFHLPISVACPHRNHLSGSDHRSELNGRRKCLSRIGRNKARLSTDTPAIIQHTQAVLDRLGARFRASQRAAHLSIAEQQQIQMPRAVLQKPDSRDDERLRRCPTVDGSSLRHRSTAALRGLAIIYISHRMAEIYELGDRLSVFCDGQYVGELTRPDFSSDRIIEMMVGRTRRSLPSEDCRPR